MLSLQCSWVCVITAKRTEIAQRRTEIAKKGLVCYGAAASITYMKAQIPGSCRSNRDLLVKKNKEISYYAKERG